jgi:hypothetical protein
MAQVMDGPGSLIRRLAAWLRPHSRRPRLVRRAAIHCPHTGKPVEVDLLLSTTGSPHAVLRCPGRPEHPPTCDQVCRKLAEAVTGPALALMILPPGTDWPEEID